MLKLRAKIFSILATWAAVWPLVTLLLIASDDALAGWPIYFRTFAITAIMVPVMSLVVSPIIDRAKGQLTPIHLARSD